MTDRTKSNSHGDRTIVTHAGLCGLLLQRTRISAAVVCAGGWLAAADCPAQDGSREIRGLTTDRPDTTEAAATVPLGLWQVESTLFGYARDDAGSFRTETFTWGGMNIKYGVGANTDLQVVFDSYTEERVRGPAFRSVADGFSDLTLRLKHNIRGNDDESGIAWALMPYVKIPTGTELSNDEWEGGLIVPFGHVVNELLTVNWMLEADAAYNDDKGKHEAVVVHSVSLAWDIEKSPLKLNGTGLFTEYVGEAGGGDYRAYANTGVTYALTENVQLDVAVNFGLNDAATDFACFGGISFRF